MCFNPGDGQGIKEAYVVEKMANALKVRFVVPKRRTQYTLSVRRLTRGGGPGACFLESPESHLKAW